MAVSLFIAFIAGIFSFLTPCVFVLIPSFLAYLGGVNVQALSDKREGFNKQIFVNTIFYVLGFTIVFALLGLFLSSILRTFGPDMRTYLRIIGGIIIIGFGVLMLGFIRVPFLEREHKIRVRRKAGYITSFLFGMSFAVAWTPCFGAVLGSIITLAATNPTTSFALLVSYALGLSLPFLLVGAFYSKAVTWIHLSAKYTRIVSILLGIFLIIIGVLLISNKFALFDTTPILSHLV